MKRTTLGLALALAVAAVGCNSSDAVDPNLPKTISLVSGNPQTSTVGTVAVAPLKVVVRNAEGDGVEGVTVTWAVASGGGSVNPQTSLTNFDGVAQTEFTYGPTQGQSLVQAIVVNLVGSPVNFTMTATAAGGGGGGGGGLAAPRN
ncbi:MAG: hypothetical protein H0U85_02200 [Gemmatimonadales bacterium]|nr:hypothetical protein [Gemmatimonadales bacterium]